MGCFECKELSPKNYDKCQKDMEYIKNKRNDTSEMMYNAPCGTVFRFGAKITKPKSKNVKRIGCNIMGYICGDNRFEIISKAKEDILKSTNVGSSEDEMKVLDNFLFRCWQMGWLDKYNVNNK